jgi:hypothetical protein
MTQFGNGIVADGVCNKLGNVDICEGARVMVGNSVTPSIRTLVGIDGVGLFIEHVKVNITEPVKMDKSLISRIFLVSK